MPGDDVLSEKVVRAFLQTVTLTNGDVRLALAAIGLPEDSDCKFYLNNDRWEVRHHSNGVTAITVMRAGSDRMLRESEDFRIYEGKLQRKGYTVMGSFKEWVDCDWNKLTG